MPFDASQSQQDTTVAKLIFLSKQHEDSSHD